MLQFGQNMQVQVSSITTHIHIAYLQLSECPVTLLHPWPGSGAERQELVHLVHKGPDSGGKHIHIHQLPVDSHG